MTVNITTTESAKRILTLAEELFFTYGFSRVTMDEVAAELRMSKKTIYKYFSSKKSLLEAVIEKFFQEIQFGLERWDQDETLDIVERLKRFVSLVGEKLAKVRALLQDIRHTVPQVWQRVETLSQEVIFTPLTRLLAEGVEAGALKADFNQELLSLMVITTILNMANSEVLLRLPIPAADVFQTVIQVMLEGVLTDEAREKYG